MEIKIFVSYSHQDAGYLEEDSLIGYLRGLERKGVTFWWDEALVTGDNWDEEIKARILEAHIALVLVSQWFLNSAYCTEVEIREFLQQCRKRGLVIFPVILSACEWEEHEWLKTRQFLPGGNETVEEHYSDPGRRKRLFLQICQDLKQQIERIRTSTSLTSESAQYQTPKDALTRLRKPTAKDTEKDKAIAPPKPTGLQAEAFFYTLDDKRAESFPNMVRGAIRLHILGRTVVNLLSQYHKVFEELFRSGCEVRILFVDPSSETCEFAYDDSPEIYRSNVATVVSHLDKLRDVGDPRFEVRVIEHPPTLSVIVVEKQDLQQSFIHVQLYFLRSATSWDRPIFRVSYGDKWYRVFQDEFNQLWADSKEWNG
jgi:hypothetical protein